MAESKNKDQRREVREPYMGDIFWKCASDKSNNTFFEGIFVNESESGMSILTFQPIKKGCVLKLYGEKQWIGARHATVKWCSKMESAIYRAGLIIV
jgi:hypothetical protein